LNRKIYDSVYVFVQNATTPFVEIKTKNLTADENAYILVPCKPTSKDIKLLLLDGKGNRVKSKFDPKIGFTVKMPMFVDHHYALNCLASKFGGTSLRFMVENTHHGKID
jgi:hypothetical protein